MREITLLTPARFFVRAYGPQSSLLCKTGKFLEAGTTVWLGSPVVMCFDHGDKFVFPINHDGEDGFLLQEEVGADTITVQ